MRAGRQDAVEVKYLVKSLEAKYAGRVNIVRVDGTANQEAMRHYHVDTYPTWILFKDGQEVWHDGGLKSEGELSDMIDRML